MDPSAGSTLACCISEWRDAPAEEGNAHLQAVRQACTPESLAALSTESLSQLLAAVAQCSVTSGATAPSASNVQAHQQKLLLERLQSKLIELPPSSTTFDTISSLLKQYTPAPSSRRASLQASSGGSGSASASASTSASRRNSLASHQLEDENIASMRLHIFRFAFEWSKTHMAAESDGSESETRSALMEFSTHMHLQALGDVWSAIRKAGVSSLSSSKPGTLVATLSDEQLQRLFEQLLDMAGVGQAEAKFSWQRQEGGVSGVAALFSALRRHLTSSKQPLPSFLASFSPARLYPLLSHAQLTVREHTATVLRSFLSLLEESGSADAASAAKSDVLRSLQDRLRAGMTSTESSDAGADTPGWLPDYESEGILTLLNALSIPCDSDATALLDYYLAHPASSVRQQVAEILARMATASPYFDLPASLTEVRWEWEAQEREAAAQAASSGMLADAHTSAVFFSIPPPLGVTLVGTAANSRRSSLSATPRPSPEAPNSPPSQSTAGHGAEADPATVSSSPPARPSHRASWQWKEGAFMALELYLRAGGANRCNASFAASLDALFPQMMRASLSWSWELRRMAEQLRPPFLAAFLRQAGAGGQLVSLCDAWLQHRDETACAGTPGAQTSLQSAAFCAVALHGALQMLQKSLTQSTQASAGSGSEDPGVDRKWHADLDHPLVVPMSVWLELCACLPPLLTRLEQLIVSATLAEHATLGPASICDTPLDGMASTLLPAVGDAQTPFLVSWDQFSTMALQCIVEAYATLGEHAHSSSPTKLRVPQQTQLQHYQCVLDRLRTIRSLSTGEALPPAPSVAAQMVTSSLPHSSTPSPAHTPPRRPSVILPTLAVMHSTHTPPVHSHAHKMQALTRARAMRLEGWILNHLSSSLAGFTAQVPAAAQIDLLDLLLDYVRRFHTSSSEVRTSLLRAIAVGWTRASGLHPTVAVWSHQMHHLQDQSLAMLLQLMAEHTQERTVIVAALCAIVANTPLNTVKLHAILDAITKLVPDDYASLEMSHPPAPSPAPVLSPASAAAAEEAESWDDWDEEDEAEESGDSSSASARFAHAKQLVLDVAPLLLLLAAQSYSEVMPVTPPQPRPRALSSSSASASFPPKAAAPLSPAATAASSRVHAQSSLAKLVAAYDVEMASAAPNVTRQIELLQWIQQWAQQVQGEIQGATGKTSAGKEQEAKSAEAAVPLPAFPSHRPMPRNPSFEATCKELAAEAQQKLQWLQKSAQELGVKDQAAR